MFITTLPTMKMRLKCFHNRINNIPVTVLFIWPTQKPIRSGDGKLIYHVVSNRKNQFRGEVGKMLHASLITRGVDITGHADPRIHSKKKVETKETHRVPIQI